MWMWMNVNEKVTQSCPTLCNPMDYTVNGILQARIPDWVAISFSRGSSQPRDWTQVSCTVGRLFTNWTTRKAHGATAAAAAKSRQSCPTLCDPIDGSLPGSPVPGILQARTLEWVAISLSNAWKWKVKVKSLSCLTQRPHGLQPTRLLCLESIGLY